MRQYPRVLATAVSVVAISATMVSTAMAAGPNIVPGQFLVKFTSGTSASTREAALSEHNASVIHKISALNVYVVDVPSLHSTLSTDAAKAEAKALESEQSISYAEPNLIYRAFADLNALFTPNDPGLSQQWAWNVINAFQAWDTTKGSASTVIGIVDTGIQNDHPDLASKIVGGHDFVDSDDVGQDGNGHGSHVAGTSAAVTDNGTGGAGTCPNCKLMPVRVLDNQGSGTLAAVAEGITFAADSGVQSINMSLGGSGSTTLETAVNYAWNKGVFMACAAGNSNTSDKTYSYPGAYANCFAVASTKSTDARSSFSNYGDWVKLAAPGEGIYSSWINSGYNTISGTSMATPHVAGAAGLLASQGLTNAQIKQRLCDTADRISGTGTYWSCGRLNLAAAVSGGSTPPPNPNPTPPPDPTPTPTPPPSGDAIVNGSFDDGASGWELFSTGNYEIVTSLNPHSGESSAELGGYDEANDSISQEVTVPTKGKLSYWWFMRTSEGAGGVYDRFRVRVYNAAGKLLKTLRTFNNTSATGKWSQDKLSLSSYAGQKVTLQFSLTTDSSLQTTFFVDDVSLVKG